MGGLGAWAGCGPAYSLILAVPKVTATRQRPVYQLHIIRCDTIILSNAMHGQNINLSVCVCVCVSVYVSVTLSVNSLQVRPLNGYYS